MAKFGNTRFQAERLTEAREFFGMTKRTLAGLVGCSEQSISNYERNVSKPTDSVVGKLGEILHVPNEFLQKPVWPEPVEHVFWRAMRSDTAQSQKRTRVLLTWVLESIDAMEEFVELPRYELPIPSLPHWSLISDEMIEDTAEYVRSAWGLGRQPIPDMCLALENAGVPVISFSAENRKQAGFAYRSGRLERAVVGVNRFEQSLARQRFSLAHELGHLILHADVLPSETNLAKTNSKVERQAHRFAAALLFPREAFEREVYDFSMEEFATLKRTWGVAILTQIVRANDLGLISSDQATSLFKSAGRRGYRRPFGEPWDNELAVEQPRLLRRAIEAIVGAGDELFCDLLGDMRLPPVPLEDVFDHRLRPEEPAVESNVIKLRPRIVKNTG